MDSEGYVPISNWEIGKVLDYAPVSHGTSCSTFVVHTSQGKYILRCFGSYQQAIQESEVFRVLQGTKIGAELIYTKSNDPFLYDNEKYYNLQTFLFGKRPNLTDEKQVYAAAQTVSVLHKSLEKCTFSFSTCDRFSTTNLLEQASKWELPEELFPKGIITIEQRRRFIVELEQDFRQNHVIHADLGNWNMLWNDNNLQVIDFGECRAGDTYCDLAAVICSILADCKSKEDFNFLLSLFLGTYRHCGEAIKYEKIDRAIYIWLLRGALASFANIHEPSKRESVCKHFLQEMIKYNLYTKNRK